MNTHQSGALKALNSREQSLVATIEGRGRVIRAETPESMAAKYGEGSAMVLFERQREERASLVKCRARIDTLTIEQAEQEAAQCS
jgi:hypothetical protein